jgi:DNA-binding PadR family transcriptional regulator
MNSGLYSELDYITLAMVGEGVSSGYAMRKRLTRLRGGKWSSDSGSVYRVLRRLEKDQLLELAGKAGSPNRERTEFRLTAKGSALLDSWVGFPPHRGELMAMSDAIRMRCYFLKRLAPEERVRVVRAWIQENRKLLTELEAEQDEPSHRREAERDPIEALADANLLYLAQGRQEWLRRLMAEVKQAHPTAE